MADKLLKSIKFPTLPDRYVIGDSTLTEEGAAADAKATGDEITNVKSDLSAVNTNLYDFLIESQSVNRFPYIPSATVGYYLKDGDPVSDASYGYTDYIEIEGGLEYKMGLVPVYGAATTPWFACPVALEFYDSDKTYIRDVLKNTDEFTNAHFVAPYNAKYIRVNMAIGTGGGLNLAIINARTMMVKGSSLPVSYSAYSETVWKIDYEVGQVDDKIHYVSPNYYDPSLQTEETIEPHYYVNGEPYSSTAYDNLWHCTALIPVEPNTTYTVALVPSYLDYVKPWGSASYGVFCYDENGTYVGSQTANNTFTTTINTKYIRFNYYVASISLDTVNARCMLVKGSSVPTTYVGYYDYYVKTRIEQIESKIASMASTSNINYIIDGDGNGVKLIAKYSDTDDICIYLKKKGGNNLFDFASIGLIPNTTRQISDSTDGISYLIDTNSGGDWFAPFIVRAVNNGDGDNPTSYNFTGGNHQYNNQGSGSTATARTTSLKYFADNMEVDSGSDGCKRFEIAWTNLVQGYNTSKADGTGREILQENHRLIFDGNKFEAFVDLIPLEDLMMLTWYGFQWFTSPYINTRYIGGTNRGVYDASDESSSSGDSNCCHVVGYANDNEIRIDIDADYDLGDHKFFESQTNAIFTETYGKGYCNIIKNTALYKDDMYSLHGYYQFTTHK